MMLAAAWIGDDSKVQSVHEPNILGETQGGATTIVADDGLRLGGVSVASRSSDPAGTLISRNPAVPGDECSLHVD